MCVLSLAIILNVIFDQSKLSGDTKKSEASEKKNLDQSKIESRIGLIYVVRSVMICRFSNGVEIINVFSIVYWKTEKQ